MTTTPRPLRAALIGCGRIATGHANDHPALQAASHAAAYQQCPDTQLVAVCDTRPELVATVAAQLGVPGFVDYQTMLTAMRPDLVSLCTPDETHAKILANVLQTPGLRAVLAEKPLALDVDIAEQLVQTARAREIVLAVNYSRRYAPSQQALAQRLAQGELGTITTVSGAYTKGIRHNGTHWFDWLRMLLGPLADRPEQVMAYPGSKAFGADLSPHVMVRFNSGLVAQLQAANHADYSVFEMDILGQHGRLRLDQSGHRAQWQTITNNPLYAGFQMLTDAPPQDTLMSNILLHAVGDLVRALRDQQAPACTGEDALIALKIADAACRSLASGCPVRC